MTDTQSLHACSNAFTVEICCLSWAFFSAEMILGKAKDTPLPRDVIVSFPAGKDGSPKSPSSPLPFTNDEVPIGKLLSERRATTARKKAGKTGPHWQPFSSEHPVYLPSLTPLKPPAEKSIAPEVRPEASTELPKKIVTPKRGRKERGEALTPKQKAARSASKAATGERAQQLSTAGAAVTGVATEGYPTEGRRARHSAGARNSSRPAAAKQKQNRRMSLNFASRAGNEAAKAGNGFQAAVPPGGSADYGNRDPYRFVVHSRFTP